MPMSACAAALVLLAATAALATVARRAPGRSA